MADSQSLFDTLAGAFGHGVDRPGLNAYVANSQATNGLRSAQTEEALGNAQQQQEEAQAHADLEASLSAVTGDDGKPLLQPSQAHLVANELKGHYGNAQVVMQALREAQVAKNTMTESNPANLNTPALTSAVIGNTNKLPEAVPVPKEYAVPAGVTPPVVNQTPLGEAETGAQNAIAGLNSAKTVHPELFHTPGAQNLDPQTAAEVAEYIRENPQYAGNMRSLVSNGGAAVVHAFLHPEAVGAPPGSTPANSGLPPPLSGTAVPGAKAPKGALPLPGSTSQPSATNPPNGILPAAGVGLHEQALIRNDFASGLAAKQTSALNTMVQHSNLFDQIADQLGNGNFTPTNAIAQTWQRIFGSPVPSNLQIAAGFLGREAVRATVNAGAGTGQERELAVSDASSPDALHGAAQTLRSLAGGQLHSLELRARRGGVDITQLLGPEARAAYGLGHSTAPPASNAPPAGPAQGPPGLPPGLTVVN